ncbi:hypothetical protein [Streptomyces clavuligerus]|uniref:hypothetical protein n=1 Tax=Streptomyces clavuligerus TaxID=1901 RepID=UPI00017FF8A7|nr:hypothetical protein [Streptomyces clavuligerus]ANW22630.1 hypothetical protein BB341_30465 [Streptomyces clavuligerus]AXU16901.1 hypothetical protein D1794_29520 [Streptomyces clavuligerus]AXU17490.1 hypothetical protein D1794_33635 [Streptomyces clavuligerus]EDY48676.1 conserved hypothetical protein [Streptomyces clavuligerus]MBY6301021.1 hypothetical protein [Streptomyces clavuligerus]
MQSMATVSPATGEPSAAEILRARYAARLPGALDDLDGPRHGNVALPLHVVWSGLRTFDLDRPRSRMSLYRTVLAEGQRDDVTAYLDADLLTGLWPVLRTLIPRAARDAWENAFPRLAPGAVAA